MSRRGDLKVVWVAEKVGVVETAEFFKKRAGKAKGDGTMEFLRNAPEAGDDANQ